jgi:Protein of unknown function (DUF5818)
MKALRYFATSAVLVLGLASIPALAQTQPDEQQQPRQSQAAQATDQSAQQMQAFSGKIVKTSSGLVLRDEASNTSYKLDNQSAVKKFSGKNVKITGVLDSTTNTIHVSNVELVANSY